MNEFVFVPYTCITSVSHVIFNLFLLEFCGCDLNIFLTMQVQAKKLDLWKLYAFRGGCLRI